MKAARFLLSILLISLSLQGCKAYYTKQQKPEEERLEIAKDICRVMCKLAGAKYVGMVEMEYGGPPMSSAYKKHYCIYDASGGESPQPMLDAELINPLEVDQLIAVKRWKKQNVKEGKK